MSGTRSNKEATTTPSKEISDAANTKILELEEELARQKTVNDQETGELKELVRQQIELARQQNEENQRLQAQLARQQNEEYQRLQAQLAEMEFRNLMNMNNSSSNITTPQVTLPPDPCAPTYPTTMSTPSGIWGLTETATRGSAAARSLGPDLQDDDLQDQEELKVELTMELHGDDEMQDLLSEINSITLDRDKDSYLLESGSDQGSYPTG